MKQTIKEILQDAVAVKSAILKSDAVLAAISASAELIKKAAASKNTIYTCGNGGSACDAMHFVEELVARYKRERPGIRAQHLLDPGVLTCWGNDYEFESVFERQVQTFCESGDVLVALSTSGNSENVVRAVQAARKAGAKTIGLTGRDGGKLASICDQAIVVPSEHTERIQEAHITILHIFCELLESG